MKCYAQQLCLSQQSNKKRQLAIGKGLSMSVADKFHLEDESFQVEGTISSITQNQNGMTINVAGKAGHYGKVWVTYNSLVNPYLHKNCKV